MMKNLSKQIYIKEAGKNPIPFQLLKILQTTQSLEISNKYSIYFRDNKFFCFVI